MNENGHAETLVAAHPGNQNRLAHGLFSRQVLPLTEEEEGDVEALLSLPHVIPPDRPAAEEIVRLRSLIARVDAALADGVVERRGRPRTLIEHRRRLSAQLVDLLERFGLTPRSRWEFAKELGGDSLGARITRALDALDGGGVS